MENDLIYRSALKQDLLERSFYPAIVKAALEKAPAVDAVVLPCRIGDEVWTAKRGSWGWKAVKGPVSQMAFTEDMRIIIMVHRICQGFWGERIFATQEEAEAEVKRRTERWGASTSTKKP